MIDSSPLFATIAFGGLNPLAAIVGAIIIFQVFQIFYYGLPDNEPQSGWGLDSDASLFSYRWKQFIGVQILTIIIATSVIFAGPGIIFFPLQSGS
ncbi:hypothetical protein [Prochlorococcus sp. MIT 1300]|uniref:hypothetical protein n=1 Tax=Prochlorococcus sp. MIT 1300 TaxID=3096218 RepID=UPI002A762AC7|nr:hypothetical protein [Prochlorococcus sp. MIT 1300]